MEEEALEKILNFEDIMAIALHHIEM